MTIISNKANVHLITAAIFAVLITGCSTPLQQPHTYHGTTSVLITPEINTRAIAEIGQTMVSKSNVTKLIAIKLPNNPSEKIHFPGTTAILARTLPLFDTNEEGKYYRDNSATFSSLGTSVPAGNAGIFVPNNKANPPVIYHFAGGYLYGKIPVTGIEETIEESWQKDSFKRELVYSGVSQNTISILYREYVDNIARPAFSQELKYDLAQGSTIGYKGSRFEVIKATNTELTYKVIKALD